MPVLFRENEVLLLSALGLSPHLSSHAPAGSASWKSKTSSSKMREYRYFKALGKLLSVCNSIFRSSKVEHGSYKVSLWKCRILISSRLWCGARLEQAEVIEPFLDSQRISVGLPKRNCTKLSSKDIRSLRITYFLICIVYTLSTNTDSHRFCFPSSLRDFHSPHIYFLSPDSSALLWFIIYCTCLIGHTANDSPCMLFIQLSSFSRRAIKNSVPAEGICGQV